MGVRQTLGVVALIGAVAILGFLIARYNIGGFTLLAEIPLESSTTSREVIRRDPLPPPTILFSEIFPNPEGSDAGKEFIKLYNAGVGDVDLKGWVIQRATSFDGARETLVKIGSQPSDISLIRTNMSYIIGFSGNTSADVIRKSALVNSTSTFFLVDSGGLVRDQVTVGTLHEGEIFKR